MEPQDKLHVRKDPRPEYFIITCTMYKIRWWHRVKTRLWNFILPPHLELRIEEIPYQTQEDITDEK
jgi:hypothetical protein